MKTKVLLAWINDDPEIKKHNKSFYQWFKKFREKGVRIGQVMNPGAKKESFILSEKEWLELKKHFKIPRKYTKRKK